MLPPQGDAMHSSVDMGAGYTKQYFFNFENGEAVYSSDRSSWDLAFEASAEGRYIYVNGGQGEGGINAQSACIYNTHLTSFDAVTSLPTGLSANSNAGGWRYDDVCYLPGKTAIGQWWDSSGTSKKEIYLVQTGSGIKKFRILSGGASEYILEWEALSDNSTPNRIVLSKDSAYNFVYFAFDKGNVMQEPPKNTWDILFTHYRDTLFDGVTGHWIPYLVTGVLTNPYKTLAAADSVDDFSAIDLAKAESLPLYPNRNVIGWDWKSYGLNSTGLYTVKRFKNYVISTQKGQLYKLHFLDFYSSAGTTGSPSFEYKRLK